MTEQPRADGERIRAHLNLYAVLQNLEELVRLDEQAAQIVSGWDVSVQFTVRHGPSAYLEFSGGGCRHGRGRRASAEVSLYFVSSRQFNAMFDGRAIPIPLRGFTRLGWLRREFGRLTDRLEFYLRPKDDAAASESFTRVRTTLLLHTAAFASAELAALEPTCRQVAARMADGVLEVEVLPEGPSVHTVVSGGGFSVAKSPAENPTAKMTFRDVSTAAAILENRLDSFQALAEGSLVLAGQIQMIDDFALILDRAGKFLT